MKKLLHLVSKLPLAGTSLTRSLVVDTLVSPTHNRRIANLIKSTIFLGLLVIGHAGQALLVIDLILHAYWVIPAPYYDYYSQCWKYAIIHRLRWQNLLIGIPYGVINVMVVLAEVYLIFRIWNFHVQHRNHYPQPHARQLVTASVGIKSVAWPLFSACVTIAGQVLFAIVYWSWLI